MWACHTAQRILTEDLGLKKILAKWVPHDLSSIQKQERVETSRFLMKRLTWLGEERRKNIVTGDETYIYLDLPETRRSGAAWVSKDELPPKIDKPGLWSQKACYGCCFFTGGRVL